MLVKFLTYGTKIDDILFMIIEKFKQFDPTHKENVMVIDSALENKSKIFAFYISESMLLSFQLKGLNDERDFNLFSKSIFDEIYINDGKLTEIRPFLPKFDSFDHINIFTKSATKLGQDLSNLSRSNTVIDNVTFLSLEGYWYWSLLSPLLKSLNIHEFNNLNGFNAKKLGKKLIKEHELEIIYTDEFRDGFKEALRAKLRQDKGLRNRLKASTLPLTHYYYYGTKINPKVIRLERHEWIIDELERLREILQNV